MDGLNAALLDQLKDSMVQLAFVLGAVILLGVRAKAQPTRRSLLLIFLPVPLLLLEFVWPGIGLWLALYTPLLMLVLLVDAFLLTPPVRFISLSRTVSRKLSIGQEGTVQLTAINNSGVPLQAMVRDSVPPAFMNQRLPEDFMLSANLPPYSHQTISYQVRPLRRGGYRFERIHLRYQSRLGLLWMTTQGGRPDKVRVTPDLRRIRRMRIQASRALSGGEMHKRTLGLEGTQFSGLRHYLAGDDIKKMAWQATAKLEQPVVRTYEPEVEQPILVLLDAGRRMETRVRHLSKYDWALNAALAFMAVALDRGDCVGAGVFHHKILASVPVGRGQSHLNRLLEVLGETEPQPVEPDYASALLQFARNLKRRALVVLFTDLSDPLSARMLARSLESFSHNHLLMVVTFADSEVLAQAEALPETTLDAYRKGVALDLMEERRRALGMLARSRNVLVIDAPPETLDESLIRQYLHAKEHSRL
jgi:uncharacterized protein (DUF58 family)